MTDNQALIDLAEHHEARGIQFARASTTKAPWIKQEAKDRMVRSAANYLTVSAQLRSIASLKDQSHE
jgi:hypothetical protein